MSGYEGERDYRHGAPECLGVLLTNLGSPEAPTPAAVRRYLAEFLWDPRVVEIPRPLWWLILNGLVLPTRPKRSAHAYQRIWQDEGSPLLIISRRQAAGVQQILEQHCVGPVRVALAMRYGQPSIAAGLRQLREAGARRIVVLPLYPQYSAATTASTLDAVAAVLKQWRWVPDLRFVSHYHDEPGYIAALARSIEDNWAEHGRGERLLFSFHGIPKRSLLLGDPYHCQCHKTARLVAERLGLAEGAWQVSFQSRFGRAEWLQPYTDKTLQKWAQQGIGHVDVVCPGFSADCLETLEEIAMLNKDGFLAAGGQRLNYVPALNDRTDHLTALADLVMRHSQGWPEADPGWNPSQQAAAAEASRRRALALGAAR